MFLMERVGRGNAVVLIEGGKGYALYQHQGCFYGWCNPERAVLLRQSAIPPYGLHCSWLASADASLHGFSEIDQLRSFAGRWHQRWGKSTKG
ncbi:hypothetical protein GOP47_0022402 [Adiantum capillus-veneris]|uniref:Uncharacterized protein n=1 Tax=Adiantum capillus-veneris TaxID=13818 RepID=A0A9D4U6F6_ADICA|nr:hypothetical protein GOP47_0022402 [Adiantum capillus-veneris]